MFKKKISYHRKLLSAPVQAVPSIQDAKLSAARAIAGDFGATAQWGDAARLFGEQLDDTYFNTLAAADIAQHITRSIILQADQEDRIIDETRQLYTYIVRNPEGKLTSILDRLQKQGLSVKRSQSYVASDKSFAIYTFDCGEQAHADLADDTVQDKVLALYAAMKDTKIRVGGETRVVTREDIDAFLASLSHPYLLESSSARLIRHFGLYARVALQDRDSVVEFEESLLRRSTRITLVASNIPQTGFLSKAVRILDRHGLELQQVFVESMENEVTTRVRRELAAAIGKREPIRALVQLLEDRGTQEGIRVKAEEAIKSWGDKGIMEPLIDDLKSGDDEKRTEARGSLIRIGSDAQEAARIITFYITKKENGLPLNEKRDAKLIAELREDLEAAKWFVGEEFLDPRLSSHVWRPRQLSLLWGAASFVHEMLPHRFGQGMPTWEAVRETFLRNPDVTRLLVNLFEARFNPCLAEPYINRATITAPLQMELNSLMDRLSAQDKQVLGTALAFADAVQDTNYFRPTSSLAFALNPNFVRDLGLSKETFPDTPFGVYYVVGNGFRGYHNRFEDIARGGLRLKSSATDIDFWRNSAALYREGYKLAYTQDFKNPQGGLPEGGSKGIFAVDPSANPVSAGIGFVDGLMDMFIGTETILFFGPDVDTAPFMDLWAQRARRRGHPHWRTMTSAKSEMGIPHDVYGMTTATVIHWERLLLKKLGIEEKGSTKVITGGPRGDLGGNEIKESVKAGVKILAVSDRSGVLYDPDGLNPDELMRLVDGHLRVESFQDGKLGVKGTIVRRDGSSKAFTLQDGRVVTWDYATANREIIFEIEADVLMPGDMREDLVNKDNVRRLIGAERQPRYKIISEGANLSLTMEARQILEDAGVYIVKDASANHGGVASSSREIQAAFQLDDPEEFAPIREIMVDQIQAGSRRFVEAEFALMQRYRTEAEAAYTAGESTGPKPDLWYYSSTSVRIGQTIRTLKKQFLAYFKENGLPDDPAIQGVIRKHVLPIVLERFGEDRLSRIPRKYREAMVAEMLAQNIVYSYGLGCLESVGQITLDTILVEARRLTQPS